MRISILTSVAIGATVATGSGYASCVATYETIVRGRFIRCESANFHIEASGANGVINRAIDEALALFDPKYHDTILERLPRPQPVADVVAVVSLDWHVTIAPWVRGASDTVELYDEPQEFSEVVRYWWRGSADSCRAMTVGASVDLWVYPPCCDTIPGEYACLVSMRYAEPAPDPMRGALSKVLGGR